VTVTAGSPAGERKTHYRVSPGGRKAAPANKQRATDGALTVMRFPFSPVATMAKGRPAGSLVFAVVLGDRLFVRVDRQGEYCLRLVVFSGLVLSYPDHRRLCQMAEYA